MCVRNSNELLLNSIDKRSLVENQVVDNDPVLVGSYQLQIRVPDRD